MFSYSERNHWDFSDAGHSTDDKGPGITGGKIFRGNRIGDMVRETAQNSEDAIDDTLPVGTPVKMVYEYIYIDRDDLPGINRLSEVMDYCYDYLALKEGARLDEVEILKAANNKYLKSGKPVPVLKISDYNTVGLDDRRVSSLLRSEGITFKTEGDTAGSHGFGKFAPFLLSPVNVILYSSLTKDGKYVFQGKALLSTFKEEGKRKQGTSLYGYESEDHTDFYPISDQNEVPEVFRRTESGTDLYVLCFEKSDDWAERVVFSALENFFYAVYTGKIEFSVKEDIREIRIVKDTLADIMEEYEKLYFENYADMDMNAEFEFRAPMYWRVLNDPRTVRKVNPDFKGKGETQLYILMGEEIEGKTVLEMRKSGMKIQEDRSFRSLPSFNGVFIATGAGKEECDYRGNISKFLREMESPAHISWKKEDVEKPEIKEESGRIIREIHNWIRDEVVNLIPKDDGESVDVFGLSKILPDLTDTGAEHMNEDAFATFRPLALSSEEKNTKKKKPKNLEKKNNGRGIHTDLDPRPRPTPDPDRDKKHRDNHQRKKIVARPVRLTRVKTPFVSDTKSYRVSFIPEKDANPLMVKIDIIGEDERVFETEIVKAQAHEEKLKIEDGFILVPDAHHNERRIIDVSLSESAVYALEVSAYVKD